MHDETILTDSGHFDYDVFISYRSSLSPDKQVAEMLQRVIETSPVPRPLRGHLVSKSRWRSRLRVFRDRTDLNAMVNLDAALKQKLQFSAAIHPTSWFNAIGPATNFNGV